MSKIDKALKDLFDRRKTNNQVYEQVIATLKKLGAEVDESRKGSNVLIFMKDKRNPAEEQATNLHRPHPGKELKPYAVKNLRRFLEDLNYWPPGGDDED